MPFPLGNGEEDEGGNENRGAELEDGGGVSLDAEEGPSCHAGIEGRAGILGNGEAGAPPTEGPRLSRSAFSDLSSCWSSANDWFWLSLFFSIIWNTPSTQGIIVEGCEVTAYLGEHIPNIVHLFSDLAHFVPSLHLAFTHLLHRVLDISHSPVHLRALFLDRHLDRGGVRLYFFQQRFGGIELGSERVPVFFICGRGRWPEVRQEIFLSRENGKRGWGHRK